MTETAKTAGADASRPVMLDAVALHFKRRADHFEQEALMLAITVREQAEKLRQAEVLLAGLEKAHG